MEHEAVRLKLKRIEFDKYLHEETPQLSKISKRIEFDEYLEEETSQLSKIPRLCKRKIYTDGTESISSQFEENNPHLGMISNMASIVTIFV